MRSKARIDYRTTFLKGLPLIALAGIVVFGIKCLVERFTSYHLAYLYLLIFMILSVQINKSYVNRPIGAEVPVPARRVDYRLNRNQKFSLLAGIILAMLPAAYAVRLADVVWQSLHDSTGLTNAIWHELITQKGYFSIACNNIAVQISILTVFSTMYFYRAPVDKKARAVLFLMIGLMILFDYMFTVGVQRAMRLSNEFSASVTEISKNIAISKYPP